MSSEPENCQRCGNGPDPDLRTLWMACFYAMEELGLPFKQVKVGDRSYYTLRVCKDCRADWMMDIKKWFLNPPRREGCGSGIFVRRNGTTVEVTEEEWYRDNPGREPVRMRT